MQTPAGAQFLFDTALKSDFLFWAAIRIVRDTVIESILATPPAVVATADVQEQARVARMLEQILPVNPRRMDLLNDAKVTSTLPRYDLERIAVPTLVMSVADDLFGTFSNALYTAAHVPDARFISYPAGGHMWVGRQNEVVSEIVTFPDRAEELGTDSGCAQRRLLTCVNG